MAVHVASMYSASTKKPVCASCNTMEFIDSDLSMFETDTVLVLKCDLVVEKRSPLSCCSSDVLAVAKRSSSETVIRIGIIGLLNCDVYRLEIP